LTNYVRILCLQAAAALHDLWLSTDIAAENSMLAV